MSRAFTWVGAGVGLGLGLGLGEGADFGDVDGLIGPAPDGVGARAGLPGGAYADAVGRGVVVRRLQSPSDMQDDYYDFMVVEYAFDDEDTWTGVEPTADLSLTQLFDLSDVTCELLSR